jgi:hypothetical protein
MVYGVVHPVSPFPLTDFSGEGFVSEGSPRAAIANLSGNDIGFTPPGILARRSKKQRAGTSMKSHI